MLSTMRTLPPEGASCHVTNARRHLGRPPSADFSPLDSLLLDDRQLYTLPFTHAHTHHISPPSSNKLSFLDDVDLLVGDRFTNEILNVSAQPEIINPSPPSSSPPSLSAAAAAGADETVTSSTVTSSTVTSSCCTTNTAAVSRAVDTSTASSVHVRARGRGTKVLVKPPVPTSQSPVVASAPAPAVQHSEAGILQVSVTLEQLHMVYSGRLRVILRAFPDRHHNDPVLPDDNKPLIYPPQQQQQQSDVCSSAPAGSVTDDALLDDWLVSLDESHDLPLATASSSTTTPDHQQAAGCVLTPLHGQTADQWSLLPEDLQDVVLDNVSMLDEAVSCMMSPPSSTTSSSSSWQYCPSSCSPSPISPSQQQSGGGASLPLHSANTVLEDLLADPPSCSHYVSHCTQQQQQQQDEHQMLLLSPLSGTPVPQLPCGEGVLMSTDVSLHSPPEYCPKTAIASPQCNIQDQDQQLHQHHQEEQCARPMKRQSRERTRRSAAPYSRGCSSTANKTQPAAAAATAVNVFGAVPREEDDRRQRKRLQNKLAATRYRQKKREEIHVVALDEDALENRNRELKERVGSLTRELDYLRQLMREVLKHKQVM